MELIGFVSVILVNVVHGFVAFNLIQFFRGKETPLEKLAKRYQNKKAQQKSQSDKLKR